MRNLTTALRIFFFLIFCINPLAFETNKTTTFEDAEQLDPSRIKKLITKYKNIIVVVGKKLGLQRADNASNRVI